jgi:hypothetical protein
MEQWVFPVEVEGTRALGFDTGLSARSFAQAKLAQFITEPGLIVRPGDIALWQASGVREIAADGNPVDGNLVGGNPVGGKQTMVVWGPLFAGERLDLLLNNAPQDQALAAISAWLQAVLTLQNNPRFTAPLWPCAALLAKEERDGIFFAPPSLVQRCMMAAADSESYVHPDLHGMEAVAFTAAVMLYRLFAGTLPFSATDRSLLHQDMREGNFLPVHFAVPGLDGQLSSLIQNALAGKRDDGAVVNRAAIPVKLSTVLRTISHASALVRPLSEADTLLLEKGKNQFLKINTATVRTKRFVMRNMAMLLGILAAITAVSLIIFTVIKTRADLPTTAGMNSVQVIEHYYNAFGDMDHQMMEACVTGGAGKNDIGAVINFFALTKSRQAYEMRFSPVVISPRQWQENGGGPIDIPLFGVADIRLEWLSGGEAAEEIRYLVNYTFWVPFQVADEPGGISTADPPLSVAYYRSDLLTLVRKKGDWRITAIERTIDKVGSY